MTISRRRSGWSAALALTGLALAGLMFGAVAPATAQSFVNGPPDDPDYFPIGVWLQQPRFAKTYRDIGVNLYIGLHQGATQEKLEELQQAGMQTLVSQNSYALSVIRSGNNPLADLIVGWTQQDEPDNAQARTGGGFDPPVTPAEMINRYNAFKANDPTRPVFLNLSQGVAWDGWVGRGVRTNHPEDYPLYAQASDIVSFDIYPAASDRPQIAGELWRVGYGVKRLREWAGDHQPVWNFVETTRIHGTHKATSHEVRAMVWMSLVHGSTGIQYFVHEWDQQGNLVSDRALLLDSAMTAAVSAINHQIHELAPVLNSVTAVGTHTVDLLTGQENDAVERDYGIDPVATMLKRMDDALYLFAVRMRDDAATAQFTVDGLPGLHWAEVLGEDRQIAVIDGVFQDDFIGWDTHLYRIVPEPAAAVWLGAAALLWRRGRSGASGVSGAAGASGGRGSAL